VERAPTPAHAQRLSVKTVAAVLKVYRVRRFTVESIRGALQTPAVHVAPGTVEAAGAHIALLLPRLRLLQEQCTAVARRIEARLEELGQEAVPGEHRDVTILRSLPGVGRVVAATVLAEAAQALAERDYQTLRAHGGIAPVTRKSGKKLSVNMRYGCNPRLRNAFYHWARTRLNPKQLDRFRDRHTVAGAKDDRRDAFVLADSLRTDRPAFRRGTGSSPPPVSTWIASRDSGVGTTSTSPWCSGP
jgi:transposase